MVKLLQSLVVVLLSISFSQHVVSLAFSTAPARSERTFKVTRGQRQQEDVVVDVAGTNTILKTATMTEDPVTISIADLDNPEVRLKASRLRRRRPRPRMHRLVTQQQQQRTGAEDSFKMGQEMALKAVQEVYQEYNIIKNVQPFDAAAPIAATALAAMEQKFKLGQEAAQKALLEVYQEYNIKDVLQQTVATTTAAAAEAVPSSRVVVVRQEKEEIISLKKVVKGWFVKRAPILHHVLHEQKLKLVKGLKEIRSLLFVTENDYALGDIFLHDG